MFGSSLPCTITAAAAAAKLQEQVQAKALQELMTQMTDQCFNRCAKTSGGERLTSSEQGCLAQCMDRCVNLTSTQRRQKPIVNLSSTQGRWEPIG